MTTFDYVMLILASASPRRQELLRNAGIAFEVQPAHIPEDPTWRNPKALPNGWPAKRRKRWQAATAGCVLGADTIVVMDGQILGKPPILPTRRECYGCFPDTTMK